MFQTNAIEISTVGEALDDGAINDTIRVRNNDSKQVVRAKIISNNQVLAGAI
jgi:flagella basal body P-ring formation protein FlgA